VFLSQLFVKFILKAFASKNQSQKSLFKNRFEKFVFLNGFKWKSSQVKFVGLIKVYNFDIKFVFIQLHMKNYQV